MFRCITPYRTYSAFFRGEGDEVGGFQQVEDGFRQVAGGEEGHALAEQADIFRGVLKGQLGDQPKIDIHRLKVYHTLVADVKG